MLLLSALLTVYSVFSMKNLGFSGDEPHYLLLTKSIIYDGDLDVKNQFMEKQWQEFYRMKVNLVPHAHSVRGGWYSIHLPALSILVSPFYLLSKPFPTEIKKIIIRLGFSLYGLLFLLLLYHFLRREFGEEISLKATLITAITVPAFPFFFHIYPEVPAALLTLFSLYTILYLKNKYFLGVIGLLSGFFPWFGVKYFIYLFALLIIAIFILKKDSPIFIMPQVLSTIPFFAYLKIHYGTFSTLPVYFGILSPEKKAELIKAIIYKIPMELRIGSFLDYFLDQRDGLLPYAPVAIFALAALIKYWKKKPAIIGLLFFLPFVFSYGWQTQRGGYSPPARPLASLVWVLAIGYAIFIKEARNKNLRFAFWSMVSLSVLLSILLSSNPFAYYGPTTHDVANRVGLLFHKLSTPLIYLPNYLPSFLKHPSAPITKWAPNYFWTLFLVLVLTYMIISFNKTSKDSRITFSSLLFVILLPFLVMPQIPLSNGRLFMGRKGRALIYNWRKIQGRCIKGMKDESIVIVTKSPIEISGKGKVLIQGLKKIDLSGKKTINPWEFPHFKFKGGYFIEIRLIKGESIFICP